MPTTNDALTGDPIIGVHFEIQVGTITGYFTAVSGLGSETEVTEHKIVGTGSKESIRKIPGRLKWGDITLKRGITANLDMWDWVQKVRDGKVSEARQDGSIRAYSQEGTLIAQWDFLAAWPSSITGPDLKSEDSAVGVEEMVVVHEGIVRVS
jgi:phage tail-like protein